MVFIAASGFVVNAQPFVKYCSLFDATNQGKTVTSTALMFHSTVGRVDGSDTFLYSAECNGPDYFAIPEGSSKVWGKWNRFFDKLPPEKNLILEIRFEGKSEVATAYLFGSLDGWARAQITLSKIISIKDVTKTSGTLAKHEVEKPEVERIEGLRALLDVFLSSLYAPSNSEQPLLDLLSNDFRFVDLTGKVFGKDQYTSLNVPWAESLAGVKESRMNRRLISTTKDMMKWRATFELLFNAAPSKTYYCDVTLVLRDGEWIIGDATMLTKH